MWIAYPSNIILKFLFVGYKVKYYYNSLEHYCNILRIYFYTCPPHLFSTYQHFSALYNDYGRLFFLPNRSSLSWWLLLLLMLLITSLHSPCRFQWRGMKPHKKKSPSSKFVCMRRSSIANDESRARKRDGEKESRTMVIKNKYRDSVLCFFGFIMSYMWAIDAVLSKF